MSTSESRLVDRVVDTTRYPLSEPRSPAWVQQVSRARQQLREDGCTVLRDFIRPQMRATLREEAAAVAPLGYYNVEPVNAYNTASDEALPEGHPAHIQMDRGNAFVARDRIPDAFVIQQLYTNQLFQEFVAGCLGRPAVHLLADPLAGLCLNVIPPGRSHPWHFDTNEFAVSLLIQGPDGGGVFQYCPDIRTPEDENVEDVHGVLSGHRFDLVRSLAVRPGDLQLFMGRFSLHRVTTVTGSAARHCAIFAYSEHPGVVGRASRTKQLFGRTEPVHLDTTRATVRGDVLLD